MENAREKNQKQTRAPLAGTLSGPIMAVFSTTKILAYIRSFRFSRRFFFFFFPFVAYSSRISTFFIDVNRGHETADSSSLLRFRHKPVRGTHF